MFLLTLLTKISIDANSVDPDQTAPLGLLCMSKQLLTNIVYPVYTVLSYDVTPGNEIMPCNKIDKPLVVYRLTGNVMTSITTLHT